MKSLRENTELLKISISAGKKIPFTPNPDIILYWWRVVNEVVFDGNLKEPVTFTIKNFRDNIGWCVPYRYNNKKNRKVRIGISSRLNNLHDFLCVLIHEMVHQWQWEAIGEWDDTVMHGRSFYSWRTIITERTGAPLIKTYTIESGSVLDL